MKEAFDTAQSAFDERWAEQEWYGTSHWTEKWRGMYVDIIATDYGYLAAFDEMPAQHPNSGHSVVVDSTGKILWVR
jgi:hypothetical protein